MMKSLLTAIAVTIGTMIVAFPARAAEIVADPPVEGLANGVLVSALAKALPGDRIVLRAGEYRLDGPVQFPREGEAGRPITLCADPGQYVAILGSVRLTGWEKRAANIWKVKHPPKRVKGLYEDSERLTHPRPGLGQARRSAPSGTQGTWHVDTRRRVGSTTK